MNRNRLCFMPTLAASLLVASCLGSLQAQQAPPLQTPAVTPQRILITVESLEVSPKVMDKLDRTIPEGDKKAGLILDALYKDQLPDAVILSLQTSNDFPGMASYDKLVSFTDKDHPGKNFVDLVTSLEATPHIETDGFMSIKLKTQVTQTSPAGLPNTVADAMTLPLFHLKNGVPFLLRGTPHDSSGKFAMPNDTQTLQPVWFITENVLPASDN
jgi:hypothetical protein